MKTPTDSSSGARERAEREMAEATVRWAQTLGQDEQIVRGVEAKARRRARRHALMGSAVAACLLVVGAIFGWRIYGISMGRAQVATATVSLPEKQTLADGSVVEFRPGARVTAAFTAKGSEIRRVILTEGEAHFSVSKNPDRPFIVEAGGVEVRAVGTAFSVALEDKRVAVLVTEGVVSVEAGDAPPGGPALAGAAASTQRPAVSRVDAGKRLVVDLAATPSTPPVALSEGEVRDHLAWRAPRIRFANTPLSEAVAVFNRNSHTRLDLEPALGELRIGGVVRADDVDSFLELVKAEFGVEAIPAAGGAVQLRKH